MSAKDEARDLHFELNGYEKSFIEAHGNKNCNRCNLIAAKIEQAEARGWKEASEEVHRLTGIRWIPLKPLKRGGRE